MADKKTDKLKQTYPNWLNYVFVIFFIGMTVTAFVPGSENWRWVPFTALMSYIFIRKSKEQRVWELGGKLVMPVITFCFVVSFIAATVGNSGARDLWFYGVLTLLGILTSIFDIYIKPRMRKS